MKNLDYHHRSYQTLCSAFSVLIFKFDNFCLPIKSNFRYDLIGEKDFKLFRIKIIYTSCKQPSGSYIANIRKSGGYSNKKEYKAPFDPRHCDYLYIETPSEKYLIPTEEIDQTRSMTLSNYNSFRLSSAVEQRPVKPLAEGSIPSAGD